LNDPINQKCNRVQISSTKFATDCSTVVEHPTHNP
jgi:hypothetical protein